MLAANDGGSFQVVRSSKKQVLDMGRKPDAIGIITVMFVLGTLFTAAVQAMGAG